MNYIIIGSKVREARKQAGITLEQLAEKCKISASFLGNIERGTRVPSLETLVSICNALKVSPAYLLEFELDEYRPPIPPGMTREEYEKVCLFLRLAIQAIRS